MWKWIILAAVVLIVLFVIATYNKLVVLRNRVRYQCAQNDFQKKIIFELIQNL